MMKRENLKVIGFSTIKTSFIYISCFEMLFLNNSLNFQDSNYFYWEESDIKDEVWLFFKTRSVLILWIMKKDIYLYNHILQKCTSGFFLNRNFYKGIFSLFSFELHDLMHFGSLFPAK